MALWVDAYKVALVLVGFIILFVACVYFYLAAFRLAVFMCFFKRSKAISSMRWLLGTFWGGLFNTGYYVCNGDVSERTDKKGTVRPTRFQ